MTTPNTSTMVDPTNANKQYYSTSSPFEAKIGFYRGVRHGQQIFVSGSTAVDPQSSLAAPQILFPGDARQQTRVALEESIKAVKALGGKGAESVVKVRMYVSRREDCAAVTEGFRELMLGNGAGIGTTATMVLAGLINPEMLVEVEVDAIADAS